MKTNAEIFEAFIEKWVNREYLPKAVVAAPFEKVEATLGVFPAAYRQFLMTYGWVEVEISRLTKTIDAVRSPVHAIQEFSSPFEVVELTFQSRRLGLKPGLVPIASDGGGNYFCVRPTGLLESDRKADGPIWYFDHDRGVSEKLSPTFVEWLSQYSNLPIAK